MLQIFPFTVIILFLQSNPKVLLLAFLEDSLRVRFNFFWSTVDLQCCVVSGVQQRDSAIHTYILLFQILFPYRLFKILNIVSCAIKYGLIYYLFYTSDQISRLVMSDSLRPHESLQPGLAVHHQLPEFTQTHVHRVSDAIHPSHPLSSPSPLAPNPSQHQGLFQ